MSAPQTVPAKIRSVWPPLILIAVGLGYAVWAQEYGDIPSLMPTLTGVATALLALLDLVSRFDTRVGAALRLTLGADFRNREMTHDPPLGREAQMVGWMILCVLLMLFVGILPAVPVFIAGYMLVWGGQSWLRSILSALIVLGFVTAVFEVLLDYRLYRGVLFDPKGFAAW